MDKINVSYAILVCNEIVEIQELISRIEEIMIDGDEIIIVADKDNTTQEVYSYLELIRSDFCKIYEHSLDKNFARQKNFLFSKCTKDYIINIDADEIPHELFMENVRNILELNPNFDIFAVPRMNIVNDITDEYIQKMGWNKNQNGYINWPDYQTRIIKRNSNVRWEGDVHERIVGSDKLALLPQVEPVGFYHIKDFDRQIKQNEFYEDIVK